jgi:serine/threonine-protein kinase
MPEVVAVQSGSEQKDALLAAVLEEMAQAMRQGKEPVLAEYQARYPDCAQELRELWPAIVVAEQAGHDFADRTFISPPRRRAGETPLPASFGDFEILDFLGRGGMGAVYKARQRSTNRVVALKMMLSGEWASPEMLSRFRAEAAAVSRLDHPHIVPIYSVGEHEGRPYFAMKFIEGETLADVASHGPIPARKAAEILEKVARAVAHAHGKGILHRDLKPSNVLIDRSGEPHVTDFGLAKFVVGMGDHNSPISGLNPLLDSLTQTGAIIGTPGYMPPEQALRNRGQLSPASDVYSLGAILYHLVTGRPPFQAPTVLDTIMLVLDQEPVAPRLLNPKVDRAIEVITMKCLEKPADLRYPSARELADDLQGYIEGRNVSPRPRSLFNFLNRFMRPTHHAAVLENWGLLWMWHSVWVLTLCAVTNVLKWNGVTSHLTYLFLWGGGMLVWAYFFWSMRKQGGPITFVEVQIAHAWAAGVAASITLFLVEILLHLPSLELSPVLAIIAGMVFVIKGGTLSGTFYLTAAALFATALVMALFPTVDTLLFGIVTAAAFFVPGWHYYRQRLRNLELRSQMALLNRAHAAERAAGR